MTRQTSIDAYRKIEAEGMLSKRRWEVYDFVYRYGPTTARKAWKAIDQKTATGSIVTRFSELKRAGCVQEVGDTIDPDTNMTVILWDVTDKLPKKISKEHGPTRNELIHALCNSIEEISMWIEEQGGKASLRSLNWREKSLGLVVQCSKYRKRKKQ